MHILAQVLLPKTQSTQLGPQREGPEGAQDPQPVQMDKVPDIPNLLGGQDTGVKPLAHVRKLEKEAGLAGGWKVGSTGWREDGVSEERCGPGGQRHPWHTSPSVPVTTASCTPTTPSWAPA